MTRRTAHALAVALALAAAATLGAAQTDSSHVRFVDRARQNWLFRGPTPVNESASPMEFNVGWLRHELMIRAAGSGHPLPHAYKLVVVSLLTHETEVIAAERAFFEANPDAGEFVHWPVYGVNATYMQEVACPAAGVAPAACPGAQPANFTVVDLELLAKTFAASGDPDNMVSRVTQLERMLNMPQDEPVVVYFHCHCGCDRTGEMAAVYAMRYQEQTFTEALQYDVNVPTPPRNIGYGNQVYAQLYCNYLFHTDRYEFGYDCGRCQAFRCSAAAESSAPGERRRRALA